MGEKGWGVMRALTVEEYHVLSDTGPEPAEEVVARLAASGLMRAELECECAFCLDDSHDYWCAMNTPRGDRAVRIHETFLGIRSGT